MTKEDILRWVKSLALTLTIFVLFLFLVYLRGSSINLSAVNRAFGSTAAVAAGITLLIGPISKKIPAFARFINLRRELGLLSLGFALVHVVASLSLQERFPFPSWYLNSILPISLGLAAIIIWLYMTYISRDSKIVSLGSEVWKKRLSLSGKIAFLAIFLHLVLLKYAIWMSWATGQAKPSPQVPNPAFPPSSLFVFVIMLVIIVYRLVNDFVYRNANKKQDQTLPPAQPNPSQSPPA